MTWDPVQYARFSRDRSRPFFDMLARVEREAVATAADLGCGAGELTRSLAERWPAARVVGVDSSPGMLERARRQAIPGRLRFELADIATWRGDEPLDLVVSNAALQWVPDHEALLPAIAGMLAPGGTLAVQMPSHFDSPAHQGVAAVAARPRWRPTLAGVGLQSGAVKPLGWYVGRLLGLGFAVDAWQTTYLHVLAGDNPVLEWMKGTALRPLLDRLPAEAVEEFLAEVGAELRAAYPPLGEVTVFPFTRIFFVATRPA
jgi:trans-aconitate 2-methyltransferase